VSTLRVPVQAGAFQPFFRAHSHIETQRREPWLFNDETTSNLREIVRLRYTFLPLWLVFPVLR
jgi:alpha 1,3-glucosidase